MSEPQERFDDPALAYVRGRLAAIAGDRASALRWLLAARAAAPLESALEARIVFEIGGIYVADALIASADAILAEISDVHGDQSDRPDLAHLAALVAEAKGEHERSRALYRQAIARARTAWTPLTRVAALRNLASLLCNSEPSESVELCGLALAVVDAERLVPRARASIANVLCYALTCSGQLAEARRHGSAARVEALAWGDARIAAYATFNLAIVAELEGRLEDAGAALAKLGGVGGSRDPFIGRWALLRLSWLEILHGRSDPAAQILSADFAPPVDAPYRDAVETLLALIAHSRGRYGEAVRSLQNVLRGCRDTGDALTAFSVGLWVATAQYRGGHDAAARHSAHEALTTGREHGFRVSANWWAGEIVQHARVLAQEGQRDYVARLLDPGTASSVSRRSLRSVRVSRTGEIFVGGTEVADDEWRRGRTGSRVLRRLFRVLASAYPAGISREELADVLWPESEGDRALRNLYGATNDLRHLLGHVPGLSLVSSGGKYRLRGEPNVAFGPTDADPEPSTTQLQSE